MVKFKTKPFEHQVTAFEKFKDKAFFGLFMDMGTGKTKVAIDLAAHKFETKQIECMLVIAPNNVHAQWAEQLEIHCAIPYRVIVWTAEINRRNVKKRQLEKFFVEPVPCDTMKVLLVNVEAFQSNSVIPTMALPSDSTRSHSCSSEYLRSLGFIRSFSVSRKVDR